MCTSCTGTAAIDPKILLRDLILQLPNDYWWMVHPKEEDDVGLHKALGVRRVDIDTLLVKAGMCTRSSIGKMLFKKDKWATYKQQYLNEDEGSPIIHESLITAKYLTTTLTSICWNMSSFGPTMHPASTDAGRTSSSLHPFVNDMLRAVLKSLTVLLQYPTSKVIMMPSAKILP